jgi:cyclohexanone monooxygenase
VLTNMVTSIEHHVEWIATLLDELRASGQHVVEAAADAQDEWADHVTGLAGPIQVHETCTSWYLGANVPGKTRVYMPYSAGLDVYMAHCETVVADGYPGFRRS